jgi:hypothetical protein
VVHLNEFIRIARPVILVDRPELELVWLGKPVVAWAPKRGLPRRRHPRPNVSSVIDDVA